MGWARHAAQTGAKRTHIGYWWESRKEKELGRQTRRWMDNIKMDLVETGWCDVDWIGLAQERDKWRALVNVVMNLRVR
jgi:hypothetical protein